MVLSHRVSGDLLQQPKETDTISLGGLEMAASANLSHLAFLISVQWEREARVFRLSDCVVSGHGLLLKQKFPREHQEVMDLRQSFPTPALLTFRAR